MQLQFEMAAALREEDSEASRAALRSWFPPAHASVEWFVHHAKYSAVISEYNVAGQFHPALLAAALHGRLGEWETTAALAEGVAAVSNVPLNKVEAWRILAGARQRLAQPDAARTALERGRARDGCGCNRSHR